MWRKETYFLTSRSSQIISICVKKLVINEVYIKLKANLQNQNHFVNELNRNLQGPIFLQRDNNLCCS